MTKVSIRSLDGSAFTHIETDEPAEIVDVTLTLRLAVGLVLLFTEIVMLLMGLIVEVEFVVIFGNPLISRALMVKLSGNGCWLLC